jgi:hypothetical protein
MKKNISGILSLLAFVFGMSGCGAFLEEDPKDAMNGEELAKNPSLIYLSTVASVYNETGGSGGGKGLGGTDRGIYDLNTFTTDEAMLPTRGGDWYDGGLWQGLFRHEWGTKNDLVKSSWDYLYQVVGMTNQSLDKIEELIAESPDAEHLKVYRAELRAVRAMYYYYLLDMFGRVPVITSSRTKIADVSQSERPEVFTFVKTELEESVELLNTAHSNLPGEYYGRMTQPVAYFLLARLALNAEVYADNNRTDDVKPNINNIKFRTPAGEKTPWDAVIDYCDKIRELGYDLEPDFRTNFSVTNESSKENIFVIPMDPVLYSARNYNMVRSRHYEHGKAINNQAGWNGASATIEAVNLFGYDTDAEDPRFDLSYYHDTVVDLSGNIVPNGDVPLVYQPKAVKLDLSNDAAEKTAGARMKKYEADPNAQESGNLQRNDYVIFRYADVLLMRSEALVRSGKNGDGDLNRVRARVGAAPRSNATLANILDERLLELAWEGHRRQDLVRFGQYGKAITHRPATGKHLDVFPIHDDVLSLNSKLTQNPGY